MRDEEVIHVLRENMELKREIKRLEAIKPVLCKNCVFCVSWMEAEYYCPVIGRYTEPNKYCSEGVRK